MTSNSCHDVCRCLVPYVDGELEPSMILVIEEHLEVCSDCAERASFEKAMRVSVRSTVLTVHATDRMRARMACVMASIRDQEDSSEPVEGIDERSSAATTPPRMLSWRVVGPLAAAAALSLVLGSMTRANSDSAVSQKASNTAAASLMSVDTLLEELVDQHAHPLPPETTNPTDVARFDQFVGVPVRPLNFRQHPVTLIGARMVPVRQNRAAMLQYVMQNGHRVSVYVYNPRQVRVVASPKLRERAADNGPVYVGFVHGYSVAVADRRGVGYALASDLDEQESSKMLVAVDLQQ